jgi:hypothetical protein
MAHSRGALDYWGNGRATAHATDSIVGRLVSKSCAVYHHGA